MAREAGSTAARQARQDLLGLVLTDHSCQNALQRATEIAKRVIPGADEVSVTMDNGKPTTVASSGPFATRVDESQYETHSGPCLQAIADGEVVLVADMAAETRWPLYLPRARAAGVGSSLSVPLSIEGGHVGAFNAYSRRADAFNDGAMELAADLAAYAAMVVDNAGRSWSAATVVDQPAELAHSSAAGDEAGPIRGRPHSVDEAAAVSQDRAARAVSWLLEQSHLLRPEKLPMAAEHAARMAGASGCRVHLVTRDQQSLVLLWSGGDGQAPDQGPLRVEGTLAGRAYRDAENLLTGDRQRLWMPLLDGTERLGVLEVVVRPEDAERLAAALRPLVTLIAELIVSKGQYTDTFERTRRALPMGVAAEMLWRQLPPMTFASDRFVVSAQLEPWHEVGGDAFDYSIDGDVLRLAVFDGMGHGLGATLLAAVALSAYRNSRRSGAGLIRTAEIIDAVLSEQFGTDSFVTGVLVELDLTSGRLTSLCAAHPAPLLIRQGKAVGELQTDPGVPLGFGDRTDTVGKASLEPGDRILLFSDGVVEARGTDGAFFGTDRLIDLLARQEARQQTPPETLRRLILAVLEHQQGALQDDATLLMLEWAGDSKAVLPS